MRWVVLFLVLVATACDPSFDHPDAQPLGVGCLELTNLASPTMGGCTAGDTIVIGDEIFLNPGPDVDATITCEGVPCAQTHGVAPLAAGSLTIHVALQSKLNSDHNELDLPTLNVRALDRIDTACVGCAGVKVGDTVVVSATGILDSVARSFSGNEFDEHSSGPGSPAQVDMQADGMTWTWPNVQTGTYSMSLTAGGVTVTPSFTVP